MIDNFDKSEDVCERAVDLKDRLRDNGFHKEMIDKADDLAVCLVRKGKGSWIFWFEELATVLLKNAKGPQR